jgi:hypothetical protein
VRRLISIAMVLLFWLGPLSALLPGSDESQLPACCRRHGAHHCAMASGGVSGAGDVVSAPSRCPQYHRSSPATRGAFALPRTSAIAVAAESCPLIAVPLRGSLHQTRTSANRGPPALL